MMNRLVMFSLFAGLAAGCSDFSTTLDRNPDGSLRAETMWLVADGEQRVHAPGEERIVSASVGDEDVAEIGEISGEDLVLRTHASGTTELFVETDASDSVESVLVEVREPDLIEFDPEGTAWVATTNEFEVGYDVYHDFQHLDGAGYKAVVSAPGISVREVPLTLDQVGLKNGWTRKLRVLKGGAGSFTLTTALGGEYTLRRVEPADVEVIEVDSGESEVASGGDQFIKIRGYVDDVRVLGFDGFKAKSKTSSVCGIDNSVSTAGWGTQVEFHKPGECRVRIKNKDANWERDIVYQVN